VSRLLKQVRAVGPEGSGSPEARAAFMSCQALHLTGAALRFSELQRLSSGLGKWACCSARESEAE
jgi:hypothetical protein